MRSNSLTNHNLPIKSSNSDMVIDSVVLQSPPAPRSRICPMGLSTSKYPKPFSASLRTLSRFGFRDSPLLPDTGFVICPSYVSICLYAVCFMSKIFVLLASTKRSSFQFYSYSAKLPLCIVRAALMSASFSFSRDSEILSMDARI